MERLERLPDNFDDDSISWNHFTHGNGVRCDYVRFRQVKFRVHYKPEDTKSMRTALHENGKFAARVAQMNEKTEQIRVSRFFKEKARDLIRKHRNARSVGLGRGAGKATRTSLKHRGEVLQMTEANAAELMDNYHIEELPPVSPEIALQNAQEMQVAVNDPHGRELAFQGNGADLFISLINTIITEGLTVRQVLDKIACENISDDVWHAITLIGGWFASTDEGRAVFTSDVVCTMMRELHVAKFLKPFCDYATDEQVAKFMEVNPQAFETLDENAKSWPWKASFMGEEMVVYSAFHYVVIVLALSYANIDNADDVIPAIEW